MTAHSVGVCGFGRCGSTMLMSMLVAGGCPCGNATEAPWEGDLRAIWTARPERLSGRCVKLLDSPKWFDGVPPAPEWRFVWLDRDPIQQARSHVKFAQAFTGPLDANAVDRFAASYMRDRPALLGMLRRIGSVTVTDYERVLFNPRGTAKLLRRYVWPALDVDAAAAVVHDRDGACRPDLSVELSMSRTGADR